MIDYGYKRAFSEPIKISRIREATPEEIAEGLLWRQRREAEKKEQENRILERKIKAVEKELEVEAVRCAAAKQQMSGQMADREKAARFAEFLLSAGSKESTCWHFGRCELRELMDFIYGGAPSTDKERLNND